MWNKIDFMPDYNKIMSTKGKKKKKGIFKSKKSKNKKSKKSKRHINFKPPKLTQ